MKVFRWIALTWYRSVTPWGVVQGVAPGWVGTEPQEGAEWLTARFLTRRGADRWAARYFAGEPYLLVFIPEWEADREWD